jgi:hypothetical protein
MKTRIFAMLVVLAVLVSCITGCTTKDSDLIEILKILPEDAGVIRVMCFNIESLESDPDLADWYRSLQSDIFSPTLPVLLDSSDIRTSAAAMSLDIFLWIFTGEFDHQGIRDFLIEEDFETDEYEGVETWTLTEEELAMAFLEKMFIAGTIDSVKASIRVSHNEKPSLYSDKDVKSVVDKLPEGVVFTIARGQVGFNIPALASGFSVRKAASDTALDITGWSKFESEADAEAALDDVEYQTKNMWNASQISSQIEGQFIELTGEMAISD